ncbi:MAG: hypothetical protein ACI8QG_001850, partial [Flavobacteriales bacterium]
MRIFYIICLLLCISVSAQVVYKTVKADGSEVYSDINSVGSEPVNLSSMNTIVVPALHKTSSQTTSQERRIKKSIPEVQYIVSIR